MRAALYADTAQSSPLFDFLKKGAAMTFCSLTPRVHYLSHDPARDRPLLGYIQGDRHTLAIDAGYSAAHVWDFYRTLGNQGLPLPEFTVLTHWHYDHTFGLHAVHGLRIAHQRTNDFLYQQQRLARDPAYLAQLRAEDPHFRLEYPDPSKVCIQPADLIFPDSLTLDLGHCTARIFHTPSPHSEDTTCILIPEEGVLFLGDATSEDFFNNGYMDRAKLTHLTDTIRSIDCSLCVLSHCDPLSKADLLAYLESL